MIKFYFVSFKKGNKIFYLILQALLDVISKKMYKTLYMNEWNLYQSDKLATLI